MSGSSYAERIISRSREISKVFDDAGLGPSDGKSPEGVAVMEKLITRKCGDCTLCCSVYAIDAFDKPPGPPCSELCPSGKGCGIYEARPDECRWYWCLWVMECMDEADSPLALNVAFDYEIPPQTIQHPALVGWPVILVRVSEGSPGAATTGRAWEIVKEISHQMGCTIVRPSGDMNPEKDLVLRGEIYELEPYFPFPGMRIYGPKGGRLEPKRTDEDRGPSSEGQGG